MSNAVLTKKQRKKMRKEMQARKQTLMAKHGRSGGGGGAGSERPFRTFSDVKPKLPSDPPKAKTATRWQPPEPERVVATTVKPSRPAVGTRPKTVYRPPARPARPARPVPQPVVRDLDAPGPGPLTRAAAGLEGMARRTAAAYRDRPWQDRPVQIRAEAHRTLARVVPPLRILGFMTVFGALALAREARTMGVADTGALVVLGMGLGGAVIMLAMAEIARALQQVVRR